jgi:hypothetical protein
MYKILLLLSVALLLKTNTQAQIVNIPDANFKAALLAHGTTITGSNVSTIDTNGDGEIQVAEAQSYSGRIDVNNKSIADLTGIEVFTSLTRLHCSLNLLVSFDLSNNTMLQELFCFRNQLTTLDLSNNTGLTYLYCNENQLDTLDMSNNTGLTYLSCDVNQLISLNVSSNLVLEHLSCQTNQLIDLDVFNNTALSYLSCNENQLNSLDLSNNVALTILSCINNQLSTLDVANNVNLIELYCNDNQLSTLSLLNNLNLEVLNCNDNQIFRLDVTNNLILSSLRCSYNQLTRLNVSNNTNLFELFCEENQLSDLDVSNNSDLRYLVCYRNQLSALDVSNSLLLSTFDCRWNYPFLRVCVSSILVAQSQGFWRKDGSVNYIENCNILAIEGTVVMDTNSNCQIDTLEQGTNNALLLFDNGIDSTYALTNNLGTYQAHLDTGNYVVSVLQNNPYRVVCPTQQQVTVDTNSQVQIMDFFLQETAICPYLEIDISTPLLRRCFNSIYHVNYCNTGTAIANNVYVEVELDTNLYFNNSSTPLVSQIGNVYRFNIVDLPKGACGSFRINVAVSCNSLPGEIHCATAHIYPDSLCFTTSPAIRIADTCLTDTVLFVVTNYADAVTLPYLLLEDTVVVDTGSFVLNMGQSTSIFYPISASGTATYQLVLANGNPTYYTASSLVGCNINSRSRELLYLPNLPQDFVDIDCTPNRGSYDPNDKTGYPLGYTSNHYINPNSTIDYRIRFQNTGTDTAIFINIVDTISPYLDLSTLNMGVASHVYTLQIMPNTLSGEQVLRFQFNPIYLPDSNVNEPASNGFIQYSIAQKPNLPNGTIINNSASIYFDYNAPVQTNTTVHTVCNNCYPGIQTINIDKINFPNYKVSVIPNPFSTETRIEVQGYTQQGKALTLEVYDVTGRLQTTLNGNQNGQFFLQRGAMPTGIYFFRISENGRLLQSGRLVVGE